MRDDPTVGSTPTPATAKFHLTMPQSLSHPDAKTPIESNGSVVVIGANGSGKTRLGAWLELTSGHRNKVHRISAQKSLNMKPSYSSSSIEKAQAILWYGHEGGHVEGRSVYRWGRKPDTFLLNDFDQLMIYLFSDESEQSIRYRKASQTTDVRSGPPETKLDIVQRIWEEVLPQRKLLISGGKIETQVSGDTPAVYNASEMSDGERVIFYLIGQALAAPEDGIIIIDEPELHIHKSIQSVLWDKIESQRPDCLFVYLTHDLGFASSRAGAPKVCLTDYHENGWDWFLAPESEQIPEDVFLKILGSRKPILFVEGDKSSLDIFIYQHLYPDLAIVPRGGCEQVISSTRSFSTLTNLHRLSCFGIIDRDQRTDEQVGLLERSGVYVLNFSEVENLLLIEDVLRIVASHLKINDFDSVFDRIKEIVFRELDRNKEQLVSCIVATRIQLEFKQFDAKAIGETDLKSSVNDLLRSIDVNTIYRDTSNSINDILNDKKYDEAIKIYNNKGLLAQIAVHFGQISKNFPVYVQRLISSNEGEPIISAIKEHAPKIRL